MTGLESEELVFTPKDSPELKTVTLDFFTKQMEGRSNDEEFGKIAENVKKKRPDAVALLRDVVYELFNEKDLVSAVDVYDRLDEMGVDWFDRRYIGVILGDMKRHAEIVSVGVVRNKRRHGSKIELFKRADFVDADVLAHIEGVKV